MPAEMNSSQKKHNGQEQTLLSEMVKSTFDYWQTATREMLTTLQSGNKQTPPTGDQSDSWKPHMSESFQQMFDIMCQSMLEPSSAENITKQMNQAPLIAMKIFQAGIGDMNHFLQEITSGINASVRGRSPELKHHDSLLTLLQGHAANMQKLLNMPKLGLNRYHQERITEAMNKFNELNAISGEFSMLMLQPLESSLIKMRKTVAEMAKGEGYSKEIKEYYSTWIKILEKDYLVLLNSPGFILSFHKLVDKYYSFHSSYEDVMQDILQFLPVTTKKDMQAVYKENYLMKKEIKTITRRLNVLEKKFAHLDETKNVVQPDQQAKISTLRLKGGK